MEVFIQKYGGYIIGTLLFFLELIIWHIFKSSFKRAKHKKRITKKYSKFKVKEGRRWKKK